MANGHPVGEVQFDPAKVVSRQEGEELILMHVPSGRFAALNANGKQIWASLERGTREVSALISQHAEQTKTAPDVAAFQVLTFLDELRAGGFVDYRLAKEKETAPLLDLPLEEVPPSTRQPPTSVQDGAGAAAQRKLVYLNRSRPTMTMREARQLAEQTSGHDIPQVDRVLIFETVPAGLSFDKIEKLAASSFDTADPDFSRIAVIEQPRSDLSLQEIVNMGRLRSTSASVTQPSVGEGISAARRATRIIIVVVIIDGVIIVVVGDDTGGSAGKSRSACKTMCV